MLLSLTVDIRVESIDMPGRDFLQAKFQPLIICGVEPPIQMLQEVIFVIHSRPVLQDNFTDDHALHNRYERLVV